jgi:PDZ domain-containing protein
MDPDSSSVPDTGPGGSSDDQPDHPAIERAGAAMPDPGPQGAASGRRRWAWGVLVFLIAAVTFGGMLIRVPYVALVPGSAKDTEPLVEVAGAEEFPSEGELLLTTVRVRQRPNLWEYLWLQFDDDATLRPEEEILGNRTPEENREFNLAMMTNSKQVAIAVALEELGYEAISSDGVVAHLLVEGTPAADSLEAGDTIVAIDGEPTLTSARLVEVLATREPGDSITLSIEPFGGEPEQVTLELAENPDRPGAAFLGIQPADRIDYATDVGFSVDIDSGSVGGPSAGLAFTLAVLDQLTAGELTGGAVVAVTGTISADGEVGAVGGVPQKTAAVRSLGADVFLVPAALGDAQIAAIEDRAGGDLQIIPVASLDEALAALEGLGGDVGAVEQYASAVEADPVGDAAGVAVTD